VPELSVHHQAGAGGDANDRGHDGQVHVVPGAFSLNSADNASGGTDLAVLRNKSGGSMAYPAPTHCLFAPFSLPAIPRQVITL
jgi:hypothetical protein